MHPAPRPAQTQSPEKKVHVSWCGCSVWTLLLFSSCSSIYQLWPGTGGKQGRKALVSSCVASPCSWNTLRRQGKAAVGSLPMCHGSKPSQSEKWGGAKRRETGVGPADSKLSQISSSRKWQAGSFVALSLAPLPRPQ